MIRNVLALLAIDIILIELYRLLRGYCLCRLLERKNKRNGLGSQPFHILSVSEIADIV